MIEEIRSMFDRIVSRRYLFFLSLASAAVGFLISLLYFMGEFPYDRASWIFWAASVLLFIASFSSKSEEKEKEFWKLAVFMIGIAVLYYVSHLWDFGTAPWNSNGLFDDAAWDLYFTQQFSSPSASVQLIFNDLGAHIGRELVFHHFIGIWFRIFGSNLFSFNMALTFFGFITVLFTSLLALRIFRGYLYAVFTALLLNFFPFHFTQVYMGHRYAICAPLMMVSLYFLYVGFERKSMIRISIGSVAAALCMSSAIMGKQYLYALIGALFLYALFTFKQKDLRSAYLPYVTLAIVGFLVALVPLLTYILVNPSMYSHRESSLIGDFIQQIQTQGLGPLGVNLKKLYATLFADKYASRQFMLGFPILPTLYVPFLFIGLVHSFQKRHYYVVLMVAIPLLANVITPSYDFRLMISAPFYILSMLFGLEWILMSVKKVTWLVKLFATGAVLVLLVSPIRYLTTLTHDPNGEYLLDHSSVAVSRFIQDVAAGVKEPSFLMKPDEFDRKEVNSEYDTRAATSTSFAVAHVYLQNFDDREVMGLIGNFPFRGVKPDELKVRFLHGVQNYTASNKDLVLVFEKGDEIMEILGAVQAFGGTELKEYSMNLEGEEIHVFTIRIPLVRIGSFKEYITGLYGPLDVEKEE